MTKVALDLHLAELGNVMMIQKICEHCHKAIAGEAYRVISEEDGVVLLDLIVCGACRLQAQTLGLKTQACVIVPGAVLQ